MIIKCNHALLFRDTDSVRMLRYVHQDFEDVEKRVVISVRRRVVSILLCPASSTHNGGYRYCSFVARYSSSPCQNGTISSRRPCKINTGILYMVFCLYYTSYLRETNTEMERDAEALMSGLCNMIPATGILPSSLAVRKWQVSPLPNERPYK